MPDMMPRSLMENLITLLAYNKNEGKIVAKMIDVNLMEGDYRNIAEKCIEYWKDQDEPPGDHVADLFPEIHDKFDRRGKVISRHLKSMRKLSDQLNVKFVMNQITDFHRLQRFKSAIVESAEKINANKTVALPEIEELWNSLLRKREIDFASGMQMDDHRRVLERLALLESEFRMGISELDRRGIVPARGKLTLLAGAAGRGKTWGLIHIAKQALHARQKVVHISLEIDEEEVLGRYYQSLFSIAKRDDAVIEITNLVKDENNRLEGFERTEWEAGFSIKSGSADLEIQNHLETMGTKVRNLWVKRFKPNELTGNSIRAFLDTLETVEGFVPDMVIFDYLGLMKIDPRDKRTSLGINCVELRAIAIERNLAMVTAHQLSKKGEEAALAKGTHIAEDWSIMGTADVVLIYSVTDMEFKFGLGRIYVAKCRSEEDRFAILITQAYKVGQFCLDSMYLQKQYSELFNEFKTGTDDYDTTGNQQDESEDD